MKGWIITIVILVVLAGCAFAYVKLNSATAAPDTGAITAKVERRDIDIEVKANGKVISYQDIPIKCKASGTVITLPYYENGQVVKDRVLNVNDEVKKDQVVMQLDTIDQDRAVKKAQAVLDASVAQLDQSKHDLATAQQALVVSKMKAEANLAMCQSKATDAHNKLEREKVLLDKKLVSGEDYETSKTTADVADTDILAAKAQMEDLKTQELALKSQQSTIDRQQAVVAQNQVDLDIQKQQLDYATVTSPVDGLVASLITGTDTNNNPVYTRVGSLVQSGTGGFSGGTTVMTITDLSHILISANVDESQIRNVLDPQRNPTLPPQKVEITADAFKGVQFDGVVLRVAPEGKTVSNVVTVEVQIEVTGPNRRLLRPEMTANVTIVKTRDENVLTVPLAAVTLEAGKGRRGRSGTTTGAASSQAGTEIASRPVDFPPTTEAMTRPSETRPGRRPFDSTGGLDGPHKGTVNIVKADGTLEPRNIVVGPSDGFYYEVISGIDENDTVSVPKLQADSRFRNQNPGGRTPSIIPGGRGR